MSQYFENDKNLKSQLKRTSCSIFNKQFIFYTDNGVFAKNGVDYGSKLLLESIKDDKYNFILDVGCGYGTLGIILNKKYHILRYDIFCYFLLNLNIFFIFSIIEFLNFSSSLAFCSK